MIAKLGRVKVASGTAVIAADGRGRVTLRFTKAGRKRLAGRKTATLAIAGAGAATTL